MPKRTNLEIASDYRLWIQYADPQGLDSEEQFDQIPVAERVAIIERCFGTDEEQE